MTKTEIDAFIERMEELGDPQHRSPAPAHGRYEACDRENEDERRHTEAAAGRRRGGVLPEDPES